jgi:predicted AAA+ superfamily ATPase
MEPFGRTVDIARVRQLLERFPVVGVLGPRQVGKSTLAQLVADEAGGATVSFDLENPRHLAQLANPMLALEGRRGLVVLDEIQRRPELFDLLRVLADRRGTPARFLVLGSAAPDLVQKSSDSLAGRIAYHELHGFPIGDVGAKRIDSLWLRGGFPRSFLARTDEDSAEWRRAFVRTYVERDLNLLGLQLEPEIVRRFWTMLAHYHAQIWNASELARAFGVTDKTVRRYLDILCGTYMARRLQPWFENTSKRLVKSPKVYLSDPGLLHTLLGIEERDDLLAHPKVGASFEGFAIEQTILHLGARPEECFFWAVQSKSELDLVVVRGRKRLGFEVKFTDTPSVTPSMRSAMESLKLRSLDVLHIGPDTFQLERDIRAVSIRRLVDDVEQL